MILSDLPTGSEERVSGKHIFPDSDCLGTINMMAVYVLIGVLGLLLGALLILSVYELAVFLLLRMLGREVVSLRFGVPEDGGNIRRTTWLGTPVYFAAPYHPVSTLFIQRIGPNRSLHIRSSCVAHLAKIVFNIPLAMELDYKRAAEIQMHPRANVSVAHNLLVTASAFFLVFPAVFLAALPMGFARQYTIAGVPTVGKVTDPQAVEAGFKEGDRIIAVNNIQVSTWSELAEEAMRHHPTEEPAAFAVDRDGETLTIMYHLAPAEDGTRVAGFAPGRELRRMGIRKAAGLGVEMMTSVPDTVRSIFIRTDNNKYSYSRR